MRTKSRNLTRWNVIATALGGAAWTAVMLLRLASIVMLDDLNTILLLAVLVMTPLALPLAAPPAVPGRRLAALGSALYQFAIIAQPLAALAGSVAILATTGSPLATLTAGLWLLYTSLLGLLGLVALARMALARRLTLAGACLELALVYLPIGGGWFALARLGARPIGFSPTIVQLTAVHFHFITLAALVITGCTGLALHGGQRRAMRRAMRIIIRAATIGMLVGPLLVAAGITLTQISSLDAPKSIAALHAPEAGAAVLLALSLMAVSLLSLGFIVHATGVPLARVLLAISDISVLLTMALAVAYALGTVTHAWTITIPQMIAVHGWLNALAFGLCGLLGWRLWRGAQPSGSE